MGKINGTEDREALPEKVLLIYNAVIKLLEEGEDINVIKVSAITQRAGIGKGTAYDYFSSKEDIIASAIAFHIKKIIEELHQDLMKYDSFAGQLNCLLDLAKEKLLQQECVTRYVHMKTDSSAISRNIQKIMEKEPTEKYLFVGLLKTLLEKAIERGEIRADLPMDYLVYSVCARILAYMACFVLKGGGEMTPDAMRPFIYKGIMEEFSIK